MKVALEAEGAGRSMEDYLAHSSSTCDIGQSLMEHLISVARHAQSMAEEIGLGSCLFLIAVLHDLGKVQASFQLKLQGKSREQVNHSSAGGRYLYSRLRPQTDKHHPLYDMLLAAPIFSHHGFFDMISEDLES